MQRLIFFLLVVTGTNAYSQSYAYDANGNLSKDSNKKIQSIHYNYLNLVDSVIYEDGRVIVYTYTAGGQKLREKVIDASAKVVKKVDYTAGIIYRNDTLQQISNGDGRVVPVLPGNAGTPWEYQYAQKDLVGNVRTMLTSRPETDSDKATFETANINAEQSRFFRYEDTRRINSILFDHTNSGSTHYSERLNGTANEKYGLAKSLSVMPGDVVNLEVFAKYMDPNQNNWQQALTNLINQIANGTAIAGTVVDGSGYSNSASTPIPFVGLNGTSGNTDPGPKAYLNWLIFDRNYNFKSGDYVKMDPSGKENGSIVAHQRLSKQLTIKEAGYIYIYLSNEEPSPLDVYFDDFTVQLVKGPIVQQTDYDPFGLAFNETEREAAVPNKFLYNNKELQSDFDLSWYDYGARMYDAALGRWHVADPMAQKFTSWSPYNYAFNSPVRFIDPDGREPQCTGCTNEEMVPLSNPNAQGLPDVSGMPILEAALELLNSIPEGHALIQNRMKDGRTKIFLGTKHGKAIINSDHKEALGITNAVHRDPNSEGDEKVHTSFNGNLAAFNNMDISLSNGQTAYFIPLAAGYDANGKPLHNIYQLAFNIAHELFAHADPDVIAQAAKLDTPDKLTDSEHKLFGGAYTIDLGYLTPTRFNPTYGVVIMNRYTPGSLADKLSKALAQKMEDDLNQALAGPR